LGIYVDKIQTTTDLQDAHFKRIYELVTSLSLTQGFHKNECEEYVNDTGCKTFKLFATLPIQDLLKLKAYICLFCRMVSQHDESDSVRTSKHELSAMLYL